MDAGENLFDLFEETDEGHWRWLVDEEHELHPAPSVELAACATDVCGQKAAPAGLEVEIVEKTPMLDPFDLEDPWLLVYKRDDYSISLETGEDGEAWVSSQPESNGVYDFLEDLRTVGLGSPVPLPAFSEMTCGDHTGGSECLARTLLELVRENSYVNYGCEPDGTKGIESVNVKFYIEGEPGAPDQAEFDYQFLQGEEEAKAFSMIGFGGGDLSKSLVGLSETCDERNIQNENNAKMGYGCLTSSLVRYFWELLYSDDNVYALASLALADILPAMGGTAIGEMEGDHLVIDFSIPADELSPLSQERRMKVETILELLALGLGALTAHEMGHSLGLVPYGAPPSGLFGAEKKADFIENPDGSVGHHIDTEGLNLMQAGPGSGNVSTLDPAYLTSTFFFNELNWAYLQGRIVLLPKNR